MTNQKDNKKAYQTPGLKVFGCVEELTKNGNTNPLAEIDNTVDGGRTH